MQPSRLRDFVLRAFLTKDEVDHLNENFETRQRMRHLIVMAAESWSEFDEEDDDCYISGADMIDWFGMYREKCKKFVEETQRLPRRV